RGLRMIKAEGGITFAQSQTARFDSKPRDAVAAGVVDFVLSPRGIAEELSAISRNARCLITQNPSIGEASSLAALMRRLREVTGVDFTQYKQGNTLRHLKRRMAIRKVASLEQYLGLLEQGDHEVKALFDDLLIHVTEFFRDSEVFELAKSVAFPRLTS